MVKYVNYEVVFREIPDEVTLAINISNCPCHCKGCHSPYLAQDIGEELTASKVIELVKSNPGITCVAFMGGDSDPEGINRLADELTRSYPIVKLAWYSGRDTVAKEIEIENFEYIKVGHYDESRGPLDNQKTNQRLYRVEYWHDDGWNLVDITDKFWKKDYE